MRFQGRSRLTSNLDLVTADVKARDRDRYLSVLYAPAAARPALLALHGLDLELAQLVASTTEPMLGEIRLAWWRDALLALDGGQVPAQPLLALLAAEVLPRGVSGAELAGLEDRWLGLIGSDTVPPAHVSGGGALFALLARLGGGEPQAARRLVKPGRRASRRRGRWRRRCGRCSGWRNWRHAMPPGRGPGRGARRAAARRGRCAGLSALPLGADRR